MPEKRVIERAKEDEREGKSPSTQAGEFVREEFHHIREGKHGARTPQQAIAIGLSKARRAGVKLQPPRGGRFSTRVRRQAERDYEHGQHHDGRVSRKRSRAVTNALKREGRYSASPRAIGRQVHVAARRRAASDRSASAHQAARTKGSAGRSTAAQRAARTRASL